MERNQLGCTPNNTFFTLPDIITHHKLKILTLDFVFLPRLARNIAFADFYQKLAMKFLFIPTVAHVLAFHLFYTGQSLRQNCFQLQQQVNYCGILVLQRVSKHFTTFRMVFQTALALQCYVTNDRIIILLKFGCASNTPNLSGKFRGVATTLTDNKKCRSCTQTVLYTPQHPKTVCCSTPFSYIAPYVLWCSKYIGYHYYTVLLQAPQRITAASISECFV